MKMSVTALLLSVALLAAAPTTMFMRCDAALIVQASNTTATTDIVGAHQPLERTWTIYSTSTLTSLTFQGSSDVFVSYDPDLQTDPAPEVPVVEASHAKPPPHAHQYAAEPPVLPNLPDLPDLPDLSGLPHLPTAALFAVDGSRSSSNRPTNQTQSTGPSTYAAVVQIVVRGDNAALLDACNVVVAQSHSDNSSLTIGMSQPTSTNSKTLRGFVLTQVVVTQPHALMSVASIGAGDVVVSDRVLATNDRNATLSVTSVASGDVFVASDNETFVGASLSVTTAGSGDVQLTFAAVNITQSIVITSVASGDVALFATTGAIDAAHIATTLVGSADVTLQAAGGAIDTTALAVVVGGSGSITLASSDSQTSNACRNASVTIAGSGDVDVSAIACRNVVASIFGSGDATVQALEVLTTSVIASGHVSFVVGQNATPPTVVDKSSGGGRRSHKHKHVKQASPNHKVRFAKPEHVPALVPVVVHGNDRRHHSFDWWWRHFFGSGEDGDDDNSSDSSDSVGDSSDVRHEHKHKHNVRVEIHDDDDSDSVDDSNSWMQSMTLAAASPTTHRPVNAFAVVSVFMGVVAAVGGVAFKVAQHRARQQYQPLV